MAITTFTATNFSPLFKRVWGEYGDNLYGSGVEDPILSMIPKTFSFKGSQMNFPVKVSFGGGVGFGVLPEANTAKHVDVVLTRKSSYARLKLDRQTMIASKGKEGAFREATQAETEGKLRSFNRLQACAFYNDGTGIHGQHSGNATSGTAAAPVLTAMNTGTYKFRLGFFEEGDYVQIRTSGTTLLSSVFEITAVNTSNRQLTLARLSGSDDLTSVGAGTHDIIIQNSLNAAPMGLKGVCEFSSGTLYSVAYQRRWQASKVDAQVNSVNTPISVDWLNKAMIQSNNLSGEYPNIIGCSPLQFEKLLNRLGDARRYTEVISSSNKMAKVHVSFGAVAYDSPSGEVKIVSSRYIEDDRVYLVNTDKCEIKHAEKFGWFEDDGTVLLRLQDTDAYEARFGGYSETFINPMYQAYITNLA